jgi:anti-sigma factor RsiW
MTQTPSFRDVEKLSAYLDGQLKPSEIARLESRLQSDPQLATILKELRQARGILRQLPQRRAPRNFTLTPKMVGQRPPLPRSYPVFRFATVLATLLLFFTFATNFMAPRLVRTAAPFAYGMGGGDGEPEMALEAAPAEPAEPALAAPAPEEPAAPAIEAPAATEESAAQAAPAMEEPAAPEALTPLGTPTPAPTQMAPAAEDNFRAEPTLGTSEKSGVQQVPPGETFAQDAAPAEAMQTQPAPPIGATVQLALAGIAILCGLIALILRYTAIRKWRAKAR